MFFTSKIRRRGNKVSGGVKEADDEITQPLLPKYPQGWGEIKTPNDIEKDGTRAEVPSSSWRLKSGKRSAARRGRKKKVKRIAKLIGGAVRNAMTLSFLEAHTPEGIRSLQLAYPPFMFSAGVFMFSF